MLKIFAILEIFSIIISFLCSSDLDFFTKGIIRIIFFYNNCPFKNSSFFFSWVQKKNRQQTPEVKWSQTARFKYMV